MKQRHALDREPISREQLARIPDAKPDENGQISFGAWGAPGGSGGTGSHVYSDGVFLCSGEKAPRGEPTLYAKVAKGTNPRVRVNCKMCNSIIEKFALGASDG